MSKSSVSSPVPVPSGTQTRGPGAAERKTTSGPPDQQQPAPMAVPLECLTITARDGFTLAGAELEFCRRYLETVLDRLIENYGLAGAWCNPGCDEFTRYYERKGRKATTGNALQVPNLPQGAGGEAIWHVAKLLSDLYQTGPFGERRAVLVEIADHRFDIILAVAKSPTRDAVAMLPARSWKFIFWGIAQTVWVDFLLWSLKSYRSAVTARELLLTPTETLRVRIGQERALPPEEWGQDWPRQAQDAMHSLPPNEQAVLDKPLGSLTLPDIESVTERVLTAFPSMRDRGYQQWIREQTLEEAIGHHLEAVDADVSARKMQAYLATASSRGALEERAFQAIPRWLASGPYDVVLVLRGATPHDLTTSTAYGLTITQTPPPIPYAPAQEGMSYAVFTGVAGKNHDAVIHECRKRLRVVLAAVAVASRTPIEVQIMHYAYVRREEEDRWTPSGSRGTVPLGRAAGDWEESFKTWQDLLEADDDLALRIRLALVHFSRAEGAYDADERLEAYWKVLEEIAEGDVEWLFALPMQFIPQRLSRMKKKLNQKAFLDTRWEALRAQFRSIKDMRNGVIVHRLVARADAVVLERFASALEPLAREVLRAALSGWHQGARRPRRVLERPEEAYQTHFGLPLPSRKRRKG